MTTKFLELILDEHTEFAKSFHLQSRHANDDGAEEKKKSKKKIEKINSNFVKNTTHPNNDYYEVDEDNKDVNDLEDNDDEYLILQE